VAVGLLFLSLVVFFSPVIFGGKTFLAADTIASHSFDTFVADAEKEGMFPLWNPYIFCGMPSYGSLTTGGSRNFDISALILGKLSSVYQWLMLNSPVGWVLFFYFIFAVGVYVFAFTKTSSKIASLIAALSATFSMYIVIWIMVGHNTKIAVMAFFPFAFLLVDKLRERFDTRWALLLVLCLHFMFLPAHVQMIFYVYLALGIYLAFTFIKNLTSKEDWKGVLRAGLILAIASALAFAMDADKYLSVLEYNPYSIRGSGPLTQTSGQASAEKSSSGGLDYDYATSWSLAPGEVISFVVPFWYGFGWHMYAGPLTQNQSFRVNTYFGPQPFTDAAQYLGVVVAALAVAGFVRNRKDPFVQYLGVVIVLSLLVAFGKEFSVVYDLMFKFFPGFNKFRIPSMILVLVQIAVPLLAAYGIASFIKQKEENNFAANQRTQKNMVRSLVVVAVSCIIASQLFDSLLTRQDIQNMVQSFYGLGLPRDRVVDQVFQQVPANVIQMLKDHVSSMVTTDLFVGLALIIVTFGAIAYYLRDRMKLGTLAGILVVVVLVDLWRVDYKPMHTEERQQKAEIFTAPDHVQYLQKDSSLFRVVQLIGGQPVYDNTLAYWRIQNAYGYQGAKMRAYQDVIDVVGLYNPLLWQLMNVKYIINDAADSSAAVGLVYNGSKTRVYFAKEFLPRAFFVNRYEVARGIDILQRIKSMSFGARDVGYLMEDPGFAVDPPGAAAQAKFVKYGIHGFEMDVNATGQNLLFVSETYYPVGWKAYIDDKETQIYRLNYLFRGVLVPPGQHKLVMKFEPRGFFVGKNLSLAANVLILGALVLLELDAYRRRKRNSRSSNNPPLPPS